MATTSITKRFIIKDDKTCNRLVQAMQNKKRKKVKVNPDPYEKGKKLLTQFLSR